MTLQEAMADYLSRVIGTLVGELQTAKVIEEKRALELIKIIQDGIDEITQSFNLRKINLDSDVKV